jgi:hypothetical protein
MTQITYTRKGKNIGTFDGKVLYKTVKASKHLFRTLDAWGIDAKLLEKILVPADATIEIRDTEEKKTYTIKATEALEKGQYYHFKDEKKDHGTQIFVPRSVFIITTKEVVVLNKYHCRGCHSDVLEGHDCLTKTSRACSENCI